MNDTRTLPLPAEHREFTVKVNGKAIPREHQLLSVSIVQTANRIGSARLAYLDGTASGSDFPLSNDDLFKPGQKVEILAGSGNQSQSIFHGVAVRHSIRLRDHSASQLVVECRDAAMKLTVTRNNASYFDQSDSEVMEGLLNAADISCEVESISTKHKQLVQFHTCDWDFLLARARANGKLVYPRDGKVVVKSPTISGSPGITLQYGATLLELDAEIDARSQFSAVRSTTWDPAQQALLEIDGASPSFTEPGNLSADDLAGVANADHLDLRHAALTQEEAQSWADAEWLHAHINKVSGRAKCEGIAGVKVGDTIALAGVGKRFNGNVFVSGLRHEFDLVQGWKTHLQFGGVERHVAKESSNAPPAAGLLAGVSGLQIGVVTSNEDPDGEHRVRIRLPLVSKDDDGVWARVASLDAGDDRGHFFRPEIGDEVVAGFLEDDPRHPVILGMLHSSAKAAPLQGSNDNHEKVYKSRSGMRMYFNDEKKIMLMDTPAGNSITLSEDEKSITLADQNGNKITMNQDGISLESAKALKLKAGTEAAMESGTSFSAKAGTELKLEGSAQAELSCSAITKVSGGMVQIN